ncbi:DUF1566 domain-containing protein [Dyella lutea]|uniref:DUF1566 domain-containing protein n=1 Tax=Dyella lutea TaxID=2950441 RepID=A0ABT1FIN8_9GAMM|nr:DUF1566 domain-containing protein [Dyella lutea]MCP1375993.1 DUF1566 domain-containing protein [Dyella lutea]
METMIKIAANGDQLPADAIAWDAVLLPGLGLMFSADDISEKELNFADAEAACASLNLAGFTDWRLPERLELEAILDLTRHSPAIDPTYFRDTQSDWYWTCTPTAWSSVYAWFVSFGHGHVLGNHRDSSAFVRAVRRVAPASQ